MLTSDGCVAALGMCVCVREREGVSQYSALECVTGFECISSFCNKTHPTLKQVFICIIKQTLCWRNLNTSWEGTLHTGAYTTGVWFGWFSFSLRGFLGGRLHSYQLYLLLGSVPYIFHVVNSVCQCVCETESAKSYQVHIFFFRF